MAVRVDLARLLHTPTAGSKAKKKKKKKSGKQVKISAKTARRDVIGKKAQVVNVKVGAPGRAAIAPPPGVYFAPNITFAAPRYHNDATPGMGMTSRPVANNPNAQDSFAARQQASVQARNAARAERAQYDLFARVGKNAAPAAAAAASASAAPAAGPSAQAAPLSQARQPRNKPSVPPPPEAPEPVARPLSQRPRGAEQEQQR
jgi:hypothetical protein